MGVTSFPRGEKERGDEIDMISCGEEAAAAGCGFGGVLRGEEMMKCWTWATTEVEATADDDDDDDEDDDDDAFFIAS